MRIAPPGARPTAIHWIAPPATAVMFFHNLPWNAGPVLAGPGVSEMRMQLGRQSATTPLSRPRVRSSSSAPLRVCPRTPSPRALVWAVRDVRGPGPGRVQRDTASDGMTRAWAQPKWNGFPCLRRSAGRAAALQAAGCAFNASPGAPEMSCSSRRPRILVFQTRDAGSNPARDTSRSHRRAHASTAENGRNDWAAPEPVTPKRMPFDAPRMARNAPAEGLAPPLNNPPRRLPWSTPSSSRR